MQPATSTEATQAEGRLRSARERKPARRQPHVLLVVMTSRATQERAVAARAAWCSAKEVTCRFVADAPFKGSPPARMSWSVLRAAAPAPKSCCRRGSTGFFCSQHRQSTLAAQYRYLPALYRAGIPQLSMRSHLHWLVLLDDDSFVFVGNLVRLTDALRRLTQIPGGAKTH